MYSPFIAKVDATGRFDGIIYALPRLFIYYLDKPNILLDNIDTFRPIMNSKLLNCCLFIRPEIGIIELFNDPNLCINTDNLSKLLLNGVTINRVRDKYSLNGCIICIDDNSLVEVACDIGYERVFTDLLKKKDFVGNELQLSALSRKVITSEYNYRLLPVIAEKWGIWLVGRTIDYSHAHNAQWLADNMPPNNKDILGYLIAYRQVIVDKSIYALDDYDELFINGSIYNILRNYYEAGGNHPCDLSCIRYYSDLMYVVHNKPYTVGNNLFASLNDFYKHNQEIKLYIIGNLVTRNTIINKSSISNTIINLLVKNRIDLVEDILVRYRFAWKKCIIEYLLENKCDNDLIVFCLRMMSKSEVIDITPRLPPLGQCVFLEGPAREHPEMCYICLEQTPGIMMMCLHCNSSKLCSNCIGDYYESSDIASVKCLICRKRLLANEWISFNN